MWLPIHDEEWDGDIPLGLARTPSPQIDAEKGTIVFKANTLPWLVGKYEVRIIVSGFLHCLTFFQIRYHHDGKYNVMTMDGPLEIYGADPLLNLLCRFLNIDSQSKNLQSLSLSPQSGSLSSMLYHFAWIPTHP